MLALENNDGMLSELRNHLPAGPAGRTRDFVSIHHGHGAYGKLGSGGCVYSGENCRPLGTDRQSIRGVLDVASGEYFALFG